MKNFAFIIKKFYIYSILTLLLLFVSFTQASFALTTISGVRVTTKHNTMKAVFDVSKPVSYNYFLLDNPPRLVIDIDDAHNIDKIKFHPNKFVKKIRTGKQAGNTKRLVFDLRKKQSAKIYDLKPKGRFSYRILVKLSPYQKSKKINSNKINYNSGRDLIVAIDAGHGGSDTGAIGPSGSKEKDISLTIAKKLAASINKEKGMKALLVRDKDSLIPLAKRYKIAEQNKADLFISIHTNAHKNKKLNGLSIYVLRSRSAYSKKNLKASISSAMSVLTSVKKIQKLNKEFLMRASFMVLKSRKIPSMLIETAYISNKKDEKKLKDSSYQKKLAHSIKIGIKQYFINNPPKGTRFALQKSLKKHTVKRGETLSGIADIYRISLSKLRRINRKKNSRIYIGEVLILP